MADPPQEHQTEKVERPPLPAPGEIRPMPANVMNWEKKGADGPAEDADSPPSQGR